MYDCICAYKYNYICVPAYKVRGCIRTCRRDVASGAMAALISCVARECLGTSRLRFVLGPFALRVSERHDSGGARRRDHIWRLGMSRLRRASARLEWFFVSPLHFALRIVSLPPARLGQTLGPLPATPLFVEAGKFRRCAQRWARSAPRATSCLAAAAAAASTSGRPCC